MKQRPLSQIHLLSLLKRTPHSSRQCKTLQERPHAVQFGKWILWSVYCNYGVCWSKGIKVTSCQSWRSQEKVCHLTPATLEPVSRISTASRIKSFSKFDRQQLCSPLTYRLHIYSINRSKPFKKVCQISRLCCLLLGPFGSLKYP